MLWHALLVWVEPPSWYGEGDGSLALSWKMQGQGFFFFNQSLLVCLLWLESHIGWVHGWQNDFEDSRMLTL